MKRKNLGIIAIAVIVAVATVNVRLVSKNNYVVQTSLNSLESHAGIWDDIETWWNSKVYKCALAPCSVIYDYGNYATIHHGSREECIEGDSVAHCWECATECDTSWN